VARLIRTEKEVEGRYSEQWIVVEEDALEQWPEGPLATVGRSAQRQDGQARARGEAMYTADLRLPGMLHAAVLRSPYANARVKRLDLTAAREAPWVHGAIGPEDCHVLTLEPPYEGAPVAAVAAASAGEARRALELIEVEWEPLEPLLDPDEAIRRGVLRRRRAAPLLARRPRARARGRGRRARGRVPHAGRTAQRDGDAPVGLPLGGRHARGLHLDAVHLGRPRLRRLAAVAAAGPRPGGLPVHGRRLGAKNSPGDHTFVAIALATQTGRPVHCALTRREENLITGNRNATIQRLKVGARSDGTITALSGEFVNAIGWKGFSGPTFGRWRCCTASTT
jgi:xanthine dehydrogenase YagR molybdenum-binding subunit